MASAALRFENGVVFRVCTNCTNKILGCYLFGKKNDCLTCTYNCLFRNAKISIEGYQFLEKSDSSTASICDDCYSYELSLILNKKPAIINDISIQ